MIGDETLLDRLAASLAPVRPRSMWRELALLAMLVVLELTLVWGIGMTRPDMAMAMQLPSFWWKSGSLALIALGAAAVTILSLDPSRSPHSGLQRIAILIVLCLACGFLIEALDRHRLAPIPALGILARLAWRDGLQCTAKIIVLSMPPLLAMAYLVRRGACTRPKTISVCAGLTAAGMGAFVFVIACPHDDPLYVGFWYLVACALVTVLARLLLAPLARW